MAAEGRRALSERGWLAACPADVREAMLAEGIFRIATPGTEFMHAGDLRGGLVGLARGTVELAFLDGHPDTRAIHLAHAGQWAGYKTLIGLPRRLSMVARTDVLWVLVPQTAVERLLAQNPGWWRHICVLADELGELASSSFADLTRQDSTVRAIGVLLRLGGCRHVDPPETPVEVRVSQLDLAAMAVMSRNTLNAIIATLAERGLIRIGYRSIILSDPAGLRAIVDNDD